MAKTWTSRAPKVLDIDFRTNIVKATLIPSIKWMLEAQSGMSQNGPNLSICTYYQN